MSAVIVAILLVIFLIFYLNQQLPVEDVIIPKTIIYEQPTIGVPVVKSPRTCRCDYESVDERPLCSASPAYSALICSRSKPIKKKNQEQYVLAKRQAKVEEQQRLAEKAAAAEAKRREEENKHLEDERIAFELFKRKQAERELKLWVPDDVPKILYGTNAKRWGSATILSVAYSESTEFNEHIRKELFIALSLIQDNYKEVTDIHTDGDYSLMGISIYLTQEGKKKILESIPDLAESDPISNVQTTGIAKLDQLNNKYDVESLTLYDTLLVVEFRMPLNVNYLIEEYKSLNETDEVHKSYASMQFNHITLEEKGDMWNFVFYTRNYDVDHRYYAFSYNRKDQSVKKGLEYGRGFEPGAVKKEWKPLSSGRECEPRLAGYGKRSKAVCYDRVNDGWRGPLMVVVPTGGEFQKNFAISRYEISVGDYAKFCMLSGNCKPVTEKDRLNEPLRSISLQEAEAHAQWLTERTGKTYRLPTTGEWVYAATAKGNQKMKKDFNCRVALGEKVIKRTGIVSVKTGVVNDWGLKNVIGNVQEWVKDGGGVKARDGSYKDPHDECDITLANPHSGDADDITGFRLLLEDVL